MSKNIGVAPIRDDDPTSPWDLDGTVSDGIDSVVQRVRSHMLFWFGTWWVDRTKGVPYVPDVFGQPHLLRLVTDIITNEILSVDDVDDVTVVSSSIEAETRTFRYAATIETRFGNSELDASLFGSSSELSFTRPTIASG